ncbi:GntR family transcriptional regulator [Lapidilactobacillus gannanensis]|uniref:GntR family transcriptional regulator n=1 Tax=Lapidilactobacillus gannanensis TaxID=2486002 RepID=A0ABW4BN92_9LACO|nr:GntR family transcriptional regulator [Lapidilactobacillus gannanensis]
MAPNFSGQAYYERLAFKIKTEILQGIWQPGDKLPSVRDMAVQENLNPNTVAKTYRLLESQQQIYTEPGRGSFISQPAEQVNQQQVAKLHHQFQQFVVEARAQGLTQNQLQAWLTEQFQEE